MKNTFQSRPLPQRLRKAAENFFKDHEDEHTCLVTDDGNIFFAACENLCATHMRLNNVKAWQVTRHQAANKK